MCIKLYKTSSNNTIPFVIKLSVLTTHYKTVYFLITHYGIFNYKKRLEMTREKKQFS